MYTPHAVCRRHMSCTHTTFAHNKPCACRCLLLCAVRGPLDNGDTEGYVSNSDDTDVSNLGSIYLVLSTPSGNLYIDDFSTAPFDTGHRMPWVTWHRMALVPGGVRSMLCVFKQQAFGNETLYCRFALCNGPLRNSPPSFHRGCRLHVLSSIGT